MFPATILSTFFRIWKKNTLRKIVLLLCMAMTLVLLLVCQQQKSPYYRSRWKGNIFEQQEKEIVFLFIICDAQGDKINKSILRQKVQAEVLIKSATILTSFKLRFIVFADTQELFEEVKQIPQKWPEKYSNKITFQYEPVWYPEDRQFMISMFKPCATARLFVPSRIPEEDAVIYLDTDCVFMRPPEELWDLFSRFDEKNLASMGDYIRKHDEKKRSMVPLYGNGINGGIMLMNISRIKAMEGGWEATNLAVYDEYKENITMADQDILNILFHKHPELMYDLPCEWNYRKLLCAEGANNCPVTDTEGAALLHGNKNSFYSNKESHMQAVFEAWRDFQVGGPLGQLYLDVRNNLNKLSQKLNKSSCYAVKNIADVLSLSLKRYDNSSH